MKTSWTFRIFVLSSIFLQFQAECSQQGQQSICSNGNFILTATIDGALTALDLQKGQVCWRTSIDKENFFSSSLSEIEIYEKGYRKFLVPSLNGALFKYDVVKNKIESLPMNIESIIHHSSYLDSTTIIFGGMTKLIWGIHRLTGEIIYKCQADSCNVFKETFLEDVVIVEEIVKNINAIDSINGNKKWHFRVVELSIKLTTQDSSSSIHRNKKALVTRKFRKCLNLDNYKVSLRSGFVARMNDSNEDYLWLFETTNPIIDVWYLKGKDLKLLDPFRRETGYFSIDMDDGIHTGLLFLGIFEKQMYLKKSRKLYMKYFSNSLQSYTVQNNSLPVSDYGFNFSVVENETHCIIDTSYVSKYENGYRFNYWLNLCFIVVCTASIMLYLWYYRATKKQYINTDTLSEEASPPLPEAESSEEATNS